MSSRCCSIDEAGPNKLVQTGAKDVVNCRRRWTGYQLLNVDAIKKSWILEGAMSVYSSSNETLMSTHNRANQVAGAQYNDVWQCPEPIQSSQELISSSHTIAALASSVSLLS